MLTDAQIEEASFKRRPGKEGEYKGAAKSGVDAAGILKSISKEHRKNTENAYTSFQKRYEDFPKAIGKRLEDEKDTLSKTPGDKLTESRITGLEYMLARHKEEVASGVRGKPDRHAATLTLADCERICRYAKEGGEHWRTMPSGAHVLFEGKESVKAATAKLSDAPKTSTLRGSFPGDKSGPEAKLTDPAPKTQLAPAGPATAPAAPPSPPQPSRPPLPGRRPPGERAAEYREEAEKLQKLVEAMTPEERQAHKAEKDAEAVYNGAAKAKAKTPPTMLAQLLAAWNTLKSPAQAARKAAAKRVPSAAAPAAGGKATQLQPADQKPSNGQPDAGNPFAGFHEQLMQDRREDIRAGRHLRHQADGQPERYSLFQGNRWSAERCQAIAVGR